MHLDPEPLIPCFSKQRRIMLPNSQVLLNQIFRISDHALRKVQSGYTPFSGVFKGLLEAFRALVFDGPNPS